MALARSLPLLIFTLCAVGIIVVLAFRNFGTLNRSAAILDATAGVCAGGGVAAAAPYETGSGPAPTVVYIRQPGGLLQPNNTFIPPGLEPTQIEDVALVLCLKNERPAFRPLCDNGAIINPVGLEYEAELRRARTGEIVVSGLVTSLPLAENSCVDRFPDSLPPLDAPFPADRVHDWIRASGA